MNVQAEAGQPAPASPYRTKEPYLFVFVLAGILAAIAWIGIRAQQERGVIWAQTLVLMAVFATISGRAITEKWRGILIDHRYRINLSRLQLLVWTVVVLSALFTAVLANVAAGSASPLNIDIPSELWVLLGISTASAVASPILGDAKPTVQANGTFDDARWGDLLKGDDAGKTDTVDVGKLQMFFMTFILVISYGAAIYARLGEPGMVTALPPVDDGMNVLLGISQVGYLATKAAKTPAA